MPPKIDFHALHEAAINSGIDRDAVLSGIDRRFTASIPRLPSRAAQLLRDLYELEAVGTLSDGTNPLRTWLLNASRLSALRAEEKVFLHALDLIDPDTAATQTRPLTPAALVSQPSAAPPPSKGLLYISASQRDLPFVERLRRQLSPLTQQGLTIWDRSEIRGGEVTARVVQQRLAAAALFVPLLSADYLAERETHDELTDAMKRPDLEVVPVLVRPCLWSASPELAGRRILPRNKKAVTSHSDVDSALASVAEDFLAIVADLRRPAAAESPPSTPMIEASRAASPVAPPAPGATSTSPNPDVARPGEPLSAIFSRSGDPKRLFVQVAQLRRIKSFVSSLGRGLVIEGPSKIGKTTTLRQAIGDRPARWMNAYNAGVEAELSNVLAGRAIEGTVIIDNAQRLSDDAFEKIARRMRVEADQREPKGKLIVVGTPGIARRLTSRQRDLSGRCDEVRMLRQPDEKIREMVDLVERVTRLRFKHKEEIVRASRGSFQLAQEICFESALSADVDEVPAMETVITTKLEEVFPEVQSSLARQFEDVVLTLAKARADSDKDRPPAGLAVLWMLSRTEGEDGVALSKLKEEYPALGWELWERGRFEPAGPADPGAQDRLDPGSILQLVSGRLVSEDPLFRFYLQSFKPDRWGDLAKRAGVSIGWQSSDGKLIIAVEAPEAASVRPDRPMSLYDSVTYPFWNKAALDLRDLLVVAYPSVDDMKMVALRARVSLNHFAPGNGAPEPAWNSLLEIATRQDKLRALIEEVLADDNAVKLRGSIQKTLKTLVVETLDR